MNAILIGADRDLSARVFAGFTLPWRAEPVTVHRPDDNEAACAWLRTVVEPSEGDGLRFPCGLMHLWRSDLFQQHVMLLGSCQVTVVILSVDETGVNNGKRLLDELKAIRPDGDVLVAAVHEGGVLAPEPADIVELLGELGAEPRLDVVTLQQGSRLDRHRLAHSLRLAAHRSLERSWQPAGALDWSAKRPDAAWFAALPDPEAVTADASAPTVTSSPTKAVASTPDASPTAQPGAGRSRPDPETIDMATADPVMAVMVAAAAGARPETPASSSTSDERRRLRNANAAGESGAPGVPAGSGFRRAVVVESASSVRDYNPPNVTADMAASIAAAIQLNAPAQEATPDSRGSAPRGRDTPAVRPPESERKPAGLRSPGRTPPGATRTSGAQQGGPVDAAAEHDRVRSIGEGSVAEDTKPAGPKDAPGAPRKRGLLRSALGF